MPTQAPPEAPVDRVPRNAPGSREIGFSVPSRYNAGSILFDNLVAGASRTAITYSLMGDLKRGRESVLRELAPELSTAAMWPESGAVRSGVLQRAIELAQRPRVGSDAAEG